MINKQYSAIAFAIMLIATASLLACSPYRTGRAVQTLELPEDSGVSNKASPEELPGRWWEAFKDTELNSLMEEAFLNNLDITQAYERLNQSWATARAAGAARMPVLSLKGSGGRTSQPGTIGTVESNSFRASAAASFEIDLWNKLGSRGRAAVFDAQATEEQLKALFISISAELAELYFNAVEQRAQLELAELTIEAYRSALKRVEFRYKAGLVPAIDVYQARQSLASASARRPSFRAGLALSNDGISVLLGRTPGKTVGGALSVLPEPPEFKEHIPSEILSRRPDVRAALNRVQASDERVAAAVADRFPSFNLVGSYGGSSDKLNEVLESPNIFWNLLLEISMPIIDGGRRKAEANRTKAVLRESLALYHKTVLHPMKDINSALIRNRSTEESILLLENVVSAGENTLRMAMQNYMQGIGDYLSVLTAQQRFYDAKQSLLSSRRQLISDRIQLARVLGGTWMEEEVMRRIASNHNIEELR
jgi:NodT family efflux transporter outer membrane factor (OMF) lipoprotein